MVLQSNLVLQCALTVYQISGQSGNAFVSYSNFCCSTKRRKTKKFSQFLKVNISKMPEKFTVVKIWNVRWWHWLAFPTQKLSGFVKVSQSYVYAKIVILLITHGCGALASWAAQHNNMHLDISIGKRQIPYLFLANENLLKWITSEKYYLLPKVLESKLLLIGLEPSWEYINH